ncbi:hypothetical protein QJS04_geneDACA008802 [Acorus gramineus]|uniref:Uncharacterized protein n=1 Tax=Acorus gramineus TaxID=55184 RepID=A0AAV9ABC4_ACOGR|nr:hypothetical protein QJS04_geneDACA008802 [Acorus gramineus]
MTGRMFTTLESFSLAFVCYLLLLLLLLLFNELRLMELSQWISTSRCPSLLVGGGGDGGGLSFPVMSRRSCCVRVRASAERRRARIDVANGGRGDRTGGTLPLNPAMEVSATTSGSTSTAALDRGFTDAEFPVWERLGAVVRLSYGVGIYGAMALAGNFICSITGADVMGGFHPSLEAILDGLGYAAPPIMALLFILDDEVVKLSPHARAIRDVEDEELRSFFYGMSPWQFMLIVAASTVGEELFYRVAVQGGLTDLFLKGTEFVKDGRGIAALTGVLPLFVPFAQAFAAVITAALTGSLYYVATSPKDPTYTVAPVLQSRSDKEDLKKLFAAWYREDK